LFASVPSTYAPTLAGFVEATTVAVGAGLGFGVALGAELGLEPGAELALAEGAALGAALGEPTGEPDEIEYTTSPYNWPAFNGCAVVAPVNVKVEPEYVVGPARFVHVGKPLLPVR